VDEQAVATAVDETAELLRGDGADLVLVETDPGGARIALRLDLSGVECLDCVVPPDLLEQMVTAELQRKVPGRFELVLDDPRRAEEAQDVDP
jgi:hypothetical protein